MPARKAKDGGGGLQDSTSLATFVALKQKESGELGYFYGLFKKGEEEGDWDRIYMTPSLVEYVELPQGSVVEVTDRDPEDLVWVKVGAPMRHVVEGKVEVEP